MTVESYFNNEGNSTYAVSEIQFEDGTVWTLSDVKVLVNPTLSSRRLDVSDAALFSSQTDNLVNAMATFAVPNAVEMSLMDDKSVSLDTMMAVNL